MQTTEQPGSVGASIRFVGFDVVEEGDAYIEGQEVYTLAPATQPKYVLPTPEIHEVTEEQLADIQTICADIARELAWRQRHTACVDVEELKQHATVITWENVYTGKWQWLNCDGQPASLREYRQLQYQRSKFGLTESQEARLGTISVAIAHTWSMITNAVKDWIDSLLPPKTPPGQWHDMHVRGVARYMGVATTDVRGNQRELQHIVDELWERWGLEIPKRPHTSKRQRQAAKARRPRTISETSLRDQLKRVPRSAWPRYELIAFVPGEHEQPVDEFAAVDDQIIVNEALMQLDEPSRELIYKRYVLDISLTAIAGEQGVTQQAVSKQLAKVHERLAAILEPQRTSI